jgi:hypothetical protein
MGFDKTQSHINPFLAPKYQQLTTGDEKFAEILNRGGKLGKK